MESAANHSSCTGYYCHNCNATISPVRNYLCPDCNLGFIEKLHDSPAATSPFTDRNSENREDLDSASVFDGVFPGGNGMGGNIEVIFRREADRANTNDSRPSSSRREAASHSNAPSERRRPRTQNYPVTIEHMLSEFLTNMSRTNAQNMDSNAPVFLVSNPGDYAWGREGLDTIVTQLLNQMDSSGPPPLDKDKIKELPFVRITEQQVSENIQCSVCWDTFRMAESVRQLPCEHIYHDLCITPWLELHGTCPICRKLLSDDGDSRLGGFPHGGGFEALLRAPGDNRAWTSAILSPTAPVDAELTTRLAPHSDERGWTQDGGSPYSVVSRCSNIPGHSRANLWKRVWRMWNCGMHL